MGVARDKGVHTIGSNLLGIGRGVATSLLVLPSSISFLLLLARLDRLLERRWLTRSGTSGRRLLWLAGWCGSSRRRSSGGTRGLLCLPRCGGGTTGTGSSSGRWSPRNAWIVALVGASLQVSPLERAALLKALLVLPFQPVDVAVVARACEAAGITQHGSSSSIQRSSTYKG